MASGEEAPKYITHLGLDTSTLIGVGWPRHGLALDDIVETCNALGVPVLLPEIVLTEAEAAWQRRAGELVQKCRDTVRELDRRAPDLGAKLTLPDAKALAESYAKVAADVVGRWHPTIVPLPKISLEEAARLSARQELPFADADLSFRDSLILWSMLDALKHGSVLGLLSEDKFFLHSRVRAMATARGCIVVVFNTLEEARKLVETMARVTALKEVFDASAKQEERLLTALRKDFDRLEAYVRAELRVPEYPFGISGHVEAVRNINVLELTGAHVRLPFEVKTSPDASADLTLKVEVTISKIKPAGPRVLGVGESVEDLLPPFGLSERVVTEIDGFATLKLKVNWPEKDDELPTVEYLGVEFGTPEQRLALRLALQERLRGG